MLRIEPKRHQIAIAGQVIDGQTRKAIAGAQVRMIAVPDEFVGRLVIRAEQVRFGNPALDARRPVVDDPGASAAEVLAAAKAILGKPEAGAAAKVNGARAILDNSEAGPVDKLDAAQIILDHLQGGRATGVKRPDQTKTVADGSFYFIDLPEGTYTLRASLPGAGSRYGTVQEAVEVKRDNQGNITEIARAEMLLPPTTLIGRIIDEANKPMAMAEIRVVGSGEFTFSEADDATAQTEDERTGQFMLIGLEAGKREVRVTARGYEPATKEVMLNQGVEEKMEEDIQLAKPAPGGDG
jgi:hypothetical protein